MDYFIAIVAILLSIAGIIGCILPALPGLPVNYVGLVLMWYRFESFSNTFMLIWLGLVIIISVLDYYIPIWTAKRYGATRSGIIGSILGMLIGMFLTPIGMIAGTIIGAIAGDVLAGKSHTEAIKSGLATFAGTIASIGLKLIASGIMTWYTVKAIIHSF